MYPHAAIVDKLAGQCFDVIEECNLGLLQAKLDADTKRTKLAKLRGTPGIKVGGSLVLSLWSSLSACLVLCQEVCFSRLHNRVWA